MNSIYPRYHYNKKISSVCVKKKLKWSIKMIIKRMDIVMNQFDGTTIVSVETITKLHWAGMGRFHWGNDHEIQCNSKTHIPG